MLDKLRPRLNTEFNHTAFIAHIGNVYPNTLFSNYIKRVSKIDNRKIQQMFEEIFVEYERQQIFSFPKDFLDFEFNFIWYQNFQTKDSVTLVMEKEFRGSNLNIYLFSSNEIDISKFQQSLDEFSLEVWEEVTWCYPSGGGFQTIKFPIKKPKIFLKEAYPFINDVDKWIDGYLNSNSSILILNGPPGTGKSTLISHLISYAKLQVMTAFDDKVMSNDSLYINFISGENDLLILEDSDLLIMDRLGKDNDVISKILNVSEGIINVGNKKIVFTANLPNLDVIDKAVRRPGRCYDIVEFRDLTRDEANVIREKIGKTPFTKGNEFSLAEVYNK